MADDICHDGANFEEWLWCRLKQIGLDDEVFGSYVTGVMDAEDSTDEDRKDALVGILHGMTVRILITCLHGNYAIIGRG